MNRVQHISRDKRVQAALSTFHEEVAEAIQLAIAIQQIPAPTFHEGKRADFVERHFVEIGLSDVCQDSMHNVYGRLSGSGDGEPVVITAHSDTVFPENTDLQVTFENDRETNRGLIYGPGLADNALGVAGLLLLSKKLHRFGLKTVADIWFVSNVGEEGLGDLRGMRSVVRRFGRALAYIAIEGGSFGHVFHRAIGVRRFSLSVETAGGHSWGDFGKPSAIHTLSRIVSEIDRLEVPETPKSTFNVGVIDGGTSVNTIASRASCQLDLRSTSGAMLEQLQNSVKEIVARENIGTGVQVSMDQIGNRPLGEIPRTNQLVSWAAAALHEVGCSQVSFLAGSTDASLPISMGIPAVCIGLANSGNTHRLDEYVDPKCLPQGMGQLLLLSLAAARLTPT